MAFLRADKGTIDLQPTSSASLRAPLLPEYGPEDMASSAADAKLGAVLAGAAQVMQPGRPQPQSFVPVLSIKALDYELSKRATCCYLACSDLGCAKLCACCVKKPKEVPLTIEVRPGGRPDNSVVRISRVRPHKYTLGKCIKDLCCLCELREGWLRQCTLCFTYQHDTSYSFLLSDISAVSSANINNQCKCPCCCWCYPTQAMREVTIYMNTHAGSDPEELEIGWFEPREGPSTPIVAPEYAFLLDLANPAVTVENMLMFLRSGHYDRLYGIQLPASKA